MGQIPPPARLPKPSWLRLCLPLAVVQVAAHNSRQLKVLGLGLPRTGTQSLHRALWALGYRSGHSVCNWPSRCSNASCAYMFGRGGFAEVLEEIDRMGFEALLDEPFEVFYRELAEAYPEARVVLSVRDSPLQWFKSYEAMQHLTFSLQRQQWGAKLRDPTRIPEWADYPPRMTCNQYPHEFFNCTLWQQNPGSSKKSGCMDGYLRHIEEVKRHIPSERLLIWNAKEGWPPLCDFLGVPFPWLPFPHTDAWGLSLKRHSPMNFLLYRLHSYLCDADILCSSDTGLCAALLIDEALRAELVAKLACAILPALCLCQALRSWRRGIRKLMGV